MTRKNIGKTLCQDFKAYGGINEIEGKFRCDSQGNGTKLAKGNLNLAFLFSET